MNTQEQEVQWGRETVGYRQQQQQQPSPFGGTCRFFLSRNGCKKGSECAFKHEASPCSFYGTQQGCNRADDCRYSHDLAYEPRKCSTDGRQTSHFTDDLHPCPECAVRECRGRRCRECHFAEQASKWSRRQSHY